MIFKSYIKNFKQSLFWNLLDAVGVHLIILLDHFALRYFLGAQFHGLFHSTLSIFYVIAMIINLGLDYSLAPFYNFFSKNQHSALKFFNQNIIPQIIILIFTSAILGYFKFFINDLDNATILIMCITFFLEGIRRTSKILLQLSLNTKLTFIVEFSATLLYPIIIWASYILNRKISLTLCWTTLLSMTLLQVLIFCIKLYSQYQNLNPQESNLLGSDDNYNYLDIIKSRIFTFIIQTIDQFFSIQFLVTLIANNYFLLYEKSYCLSLAGFLKISSVIAGWFTVISYKAFGTSGICIMASANNSQLKEQVAFFNYVNNIFYNYLLFIFILIIININRLSAIFLSTSYDNNYWQILYLILILGFIESLLIIYKRWYVVIQKSIFIATYEIISLLLALVLIFTFYYYFYINFILSILYSSIFSRFLLFIYVTLYSYIVFKLKIEYWLNYKIIITSLIISLIINYSKIKKTFDILLMNNSLY